MELGLDEMPWPGTEAAAGATGGEENALREGRITAVFLQLLPRIAGFLPRNEVACVLRLLCKAAAATLRGPQHSTVHLSEPSPAAEFRWRWCGPLALRSTTFDQREQLEHLTARSGAVANLEALEARGDLPLLSRAATDWGPLLDAAVGAGSLETARWLHEQRGVAFTDRCLSVAAAGGHADACEWLLEHGCKWDAEAVWPAIHYGHVRLAERLLQLRPQAAQFSDANAARLMAAAAHACDLSTLQHLHAEHTASRSVRWNGEAGVHCISSAAGSPTPDWAAKVEWLEGLGCPRTVSFGAGHGAASCTGSAARLAWLHARGYALDWRMAVLADISEGSADALRRVLEVEGGRLEPPDLWNTMWRACTSGCVEAAQVLWDAGGRPCAYAITQTAFLGHLNVISWAAEQMGDSAVLSADVFRAAARSGSLQLVQWLQEHNCPWDSDASACAAELGSLPLLSWLHERGCPRDAATFAGAAAAGSEEVLEWLVQHGCPMGEDGSAYDMAAIHYDLPTLRCLARLGCPFAPDGSTFTRAAVLVSKCRPADPRSLQWLLDAGCPVDWNAALEQVQQLSTVMKGVAKLLHWLEQQRELRS